MESSRRSTLVVVVPVVSLVGGNYRDNHRVYLKDMSIVTSKWGKKNR